MCPLGNLLDGRMHAVRHEAVTPRGISRPPHKERGIAQGPGGFLGFECLRNVPAQCTEARFWFNTNCKANWSGEDYVTKVYRREPTRKHSDDCAGGAPIADIDVHLHECRGAIRGAGRTL